MSPEEALGVFFILIGCAAPVVVIGIIYYLKIRLEHKQIMAAIEKGIPLSDIRPPKHNGNLWIKNLTIGIALLAIGLGCSLMVHVGHKGQFIALILIAVGLAWIIRGILNRKYQMDSHAIQETSVTKRENPV